MLQLRDQTIQGQTIELGNKEVNYLGPALTLERCTVVLKTAARGLVLNDVRFLDCALEVKKKLSNFEFYPALLRGCRVTGALSGCSFGHWPDYSAQGTKHGGVEDCDFRGATLESCQFVDCDMAGVKLPGWPHFALLDPARRRDELAKIPWPGEIRIAMVDAMTDLPPKLSAVVDYAPQLAKQFHTTEAALKTALERLSSGVRL